MAARLLATHTRSLYSRNFLLNLSLVLISVRGRAKLQGLVQSEGLGKLTELKMLGNSGKIL
jgi:hypothetical protein